MLSDREKILKIWRESADLDPWTLPGPYWQWHLIDNLLYFFNTICHFPLCLWTYGGKKKFEFLTVQTRSGCLGKRDPLRPQRPLHSKTQKCEVFQAISSHKNIRTRKRSQQSDSRCKGIKLPCSLQFSSLSLKTELNIIGFLHACHQYIARKESTIMFLLCAPSIVSSWPDSRLKSGGDWRNCASGSRNQYWHSFLYEIRFWQMLNTK